MSEKQMMQELIHASQKVSRSGFELESIREWRQRAHACLLSLVGPDHHCTLSLGRRLQAAHSSQASSDVA